MIFVQVKPKTTSGTWALRAVTAAVTIIVILVLGTVAYSAYQDYSAIKSELAGGSSPAVGTETRNGTSEAITLDIPIPNHGLYTLNVTIACTYPTSNVVCTTAHVSVPPGGQGTLLFEINVTNMTQFENSGNLNVNGTVAIVMPPFASVSVQTNFGGFVSQGGGS